MRGQQQKFCKPCEILARSLVAQGFSARSASGLATEKAAYLQDLSTCLSLVLRFDEQEEKKHCLDLEAAARIFKNAVRATGLIGQADRELNDWIERAADFLFLERKIARYGYGCTRPSFWYRIKCVDVRWSGYQIARLLGLGPRQSEKAVIDALDKYTLLEIYDDVIDREHEPLWRRLPIRESLRLGAEAREIAQLICPHKSLNCPPGHLFLTSG